MNATKPLELPPTPHDLVDRGARAWREPVVIGTYETGEPMEYPAYLTRRVYQGSSGAVYPMPFHERVEDERRDRSWDAVHIENEYVRLMVLPELGGRIHVGYDKTTGYDFFYRNDVVKPALVGLSGPWLAGGVEFNWPQHHRPATYLPTRCEIEEEPDGAVTVWCTDHDPFARMQGTHGLRLRPGSSLIELRVRLTNRSETVQTFLWWANVAAHVGDDYQSFFPTDVTQVADHAKRDVVDFPAVHGSYYGVDYAARAAAHGGTTPDLWATAPAVDGVPLPPRDDAPDRIDWYHNIPVPTSYMVTGTRDDFFGGYDHGERAGFVHWADHTIAPGKKQWTWGNAPFGHAWDRNLSDGDDGAYVELMAGVFTDNQPDFSYLAPGETKTFSQYWYPISEIGPAHQATRDVALRLDVARPVDETTTIRVGVAATSAFVDVTVTLTDPSGAVLQRVASDVAPGAPIVFRTELAGRHAPESVRVTVDAEGTTLLSWQHRTPDTTTTPEVEHATEPPSPADIDSTDELVTTGIHLEQYRHATRKPEPYWEEALRRDPGEARAHTRLGVRAYRAGRYDDAVRHLTAAQARLTRRNPNPPDTGAAYFLGLALRRSGRADDAAEAFGRAAWTAAWARPATVERARTLAATRTATGDLAALELLEPLVSRTPDDAQASAIAAVLLRRVGRPERAAEVLRRTRAANPHDAWTRWLDSGDAGTDAQIVLDLVHEARSIGDLDDALRLLTEAERADSHRAAGAPAVGALASYLRADVLLALGRTAESEAAHQAAGRTSVRWCFVSRLDDADVLTATLRRDPADGRAAALLGQWLYAVGRGVDAAGLWRTAVDLDPSDAVSWRNLGLASFDALGDVSAAVTAYDRARALRPDDPRLLFERDQLDQRTGATLSTRLDRLEAHPDAVAARDDLTVELADLLTATGNASRAREILAARPFHPWEGGEGRTLAAWTRAGLEIARAALQNGDGPLAEQTVRSVLDPPPSLGEARHPLANTAEVHLLLGDVLHEAGREDEAREAWHTAATQDGDFLDMSVAAYSDQTVSSIEAFRRLGDTPAASALHAQLTAGLAASEQTTATVDYFATSLPSLLLFDEDPDVRHRRDDLLVRARLAVLDDDLTAAATLLETLRTADPSNTGAALLARGLERRAAAPTDPIDTSITEYAR